MKSKKKFAMMMMDAQYDTKRDYAVFETEEVETHMITVNSPEQAVQMAKELAEQGFGAIEVCGAFGEELARKMYEAFSGPAPHQMPRTLQLRQSPALQVLLPSGLPAPGNLQ